MACPRCGECNTGCPGKRPCKCKKEELAAFYLGQRQKSTSPTIDKQEEIGAVDPGKVQQYNVFDKQGIPLTPMRKQTGGKREKVE